LHTFPAPTGPIIAINWPDDTEIFMFSRVLQVCSSVHLAVAFEKTMLWIFDSSMFFLNPPSSFLIFLVRLFRVLFFDSVDFDLFGNRLYFSSYNKKSY